ncbi:MAG: hypothetical protein HOQ18_01485, partial [Dermatophilaceae bacterium]|nr:hypothetical protein [Dermatophilaceae bacterium]
AARAADARAEARADAEAAAEVEAALASEPGAVSSNDRLSTDRTTDTKDAQR